MEKDELINEIKNLMNDDKGKKAVVTDFLLFGKHLIYRKMKYTERIE